MRHILSCLGLATVLLGAGSPPAQAQDSTSTVSADSAAAPTPGKESRTYYGGSFTLSISGSLTQISVQPFLGYKLTPKASVGARVSYEYFDDKRITPSARSNSVGAGVFTRYRFRPEIYGSAELAFVNYHWSDARGTDLVPFFLLGGGLSQPIAPKTWLTIDVMFDLIQDSGSPYPDSTPRVTTGITTNF